MDRDVYISIRGLHQLLDDDGNDKDVELVSPGHTYKRNGKHFVAYQEQFALDMKPQNTTVKIDKDSLSVTSYGKMGTQLCFQPGKRNLSVYETPFGCLQLGITTQSLKMKLDEHNWDIDVHYSLDINNQFADDREVFIRVQDGKGENHIPLT